jgi:murein L,D-transpeptidase YcbB/YkuD
MRRAGVLGALLCHLLAATSPTRVWGQSGADSTRLDAAQVATIKQALRGAVDQGISPDEFPADPAEAAIAYAGALHGGRAPVGRFPDDWGLRPAPYDARAEFIKAVSEGRLGAWLAGLPPPDERYVRLRRAYQRYRALAETGGWRALPGSPMLKAGDSGPAVAALRARLAVDDPAAGRGDTYDTSLADAVARAQARYGLAEDGRLGPATLAALNTPVESRLAQIAANLERWRWVRTPLPALRVEVNVPDASLELDDTLGKSMQMRAIVGRATNRTPMFQDRILAVVFNPPWNVPAGIAAKEIWPKIRRSPGYAAREGFVTRPDGGLVQKPGPRCALGAVKFDLANPFGVYLHDTPARTLFALDRRALSHGCMRLEHPVDLGKRLLEKDPAWPETRINAVLLDGKTIRVPLRTPVPLFVFYWTAFVDDQDQLQFRPDIYGWDARLKALLTR